MSEQPLHSVDAAPQMRPRFGHGEQRLLEFGGRDGMPGGRPRVLFLSGLMSEPVIVRTQG